MKAGRGQNSVVGRRQYDAFARFDDDDDVLPGRIRSRRWSNDDCVVVVVFSTPKTVFVVGELRKSNVVVATNRTSEARRIATLRTLAWKERGMGKIAIYV